MQSADPVWLQVLLVTATVSATPAASPGGPTPGPGPAPGPGSSPRSNKLSGAQRVAWQSPSACNQLYSHTDMAKLHKVMADLWVVADWCAAPGLSPGRYVHLPISAA